MTAGPDDHQGWMTARLESAGVHDPQVMIRQFPDERIYLVTVGEADRDTAMRIAEQAEKDLADEADSVIVSVRIRPEVAAAPVGPVRSLADPRVDSLMQLMSSRSRTSVIKPSLSYIPNDRASLASMTGTRHHLVFGRRGAGKTTLLLEAKRIAEEQRHSVAWINVQPLRDEGIERSFLRIMQNLLTTVQSAIAERDLQRASFASSIRAASTMVDSLLDEGAVKRERVRRALPDLQIALRRSTESLGLRVYLFVDDFYYIPRVVQADVLDLLHASLRDTDIWLKIASIRHLTRWFRPSPPVGLQTGQDADIIDLDLSLQDPPAAVGFLTRVLSEYCKYSSIQTPANIIVKQAVDRLVFASGGVPRDFLTLATSAITHARTRSGARNVGVNDVNQAAGDAARGKIGELEDDLASNIGFSAQTFQALNRVRTFCLDERGFTYFRIDIRDKERHPDEYAVVTRLLEVRLVHLIDPSVSDGKRAGERSECYTLDLSQYSGYRLKQGIRVLDLSDGFLLSKQTQPRQASGKTDTRPPRATVVGRTAREVVQILRGAPLLDLSLFGDLVALFEPAIEEVEKALQRHRSITIDELVVELQRDYQEVMDALSQMLQEKRVKEYSEAGVRTYRLVG